MIEIAIKDNIDSILSENEFVLAYFHEVLDSKMSIISQLKEIDKDNGINLKIVMVDIMRDKRISIRFNVTESSEIILIKNGKKIFKFNDNIINKEQILNVINRSTFFKRILSNFLKIFSSK